MLSTGELYGELALLPGSEDFDIRPGIKGVSAEGIELIRSCFQQGYDGIDISLFDFDEAAIKTINEITMASAHRFVVGVTASNWKGSLIEKSPISPEATIMRAMQLVDRLKLDFLIKVDEPGLFKEIKQRLVDLSIISGKVEVIIPVTKPPRGRVKIIAKTVVQEDELTPQMRDIISSFNASSSNGECLSIAVAMPPLTPMFGAKYYPSVDSLISLRKPNIEGLLFVEIPKDGHCLYNAVALYLGQDVSKLRQAVAEKLEQNIEEYRPFFLSTKRCVEEYISAVRTGSEWAGDLEINILICLLNRPIISIGPDSEIVNRQVLDLLTMGEPIFVYYDNVNHYDGMVLKAGHDGRAILDGLQSRERASQAPSSSSTLSSHLPPK